MTSSTPSTPMHEVKSAASILDEDVICQSFIQGSSTLAYACLLIRRKQYELAAHVLHSLESKQASRFKDMVFYLQVQIGIETGEFATMKKRLVPRVHQHQNDMVALSLLENCIYLEYEKWEESLPPAADATEAESSVAESSAASAAEMAASAGFAASAAFAASPPDPEAFRDTPASGIPILRDAAPLPRPSVRPRAPAVPSVSASLRPAVAASGDKDFGIYQALVNDVNTQAMVLWNTEQGRFKSSCRNPELEPSVSRMPQELPGTIAEACADLESGPIHKICFSYRNLTITSFHAGAESMGLLTGNISQSLLSMVRAENIFLKAAANALPAASRGEAGSHE